jgi:Flp pilus assembly protein TadB
VSGRASPLVVPLLAGAVTGGGIFVAVRALRPAPLGVALGRLGQLSGVDDDSDRRPEGRSTLAWLAGRSTPSRLRDLAVAGRTAVAHAAHQMTLLLVILGALAGAALVGPLAGMTLPVPVVVGATLASPAVVWWMTTSSLRRTARRRRRDFVHALSAYLDLINVLLAGGAGLETAMYAAADAGDGWVFDHLRATLLRARTTRRSVWSCLADLGAELGVDDLGELSASVQLAGQHGARVASSLSARASSMRAHLLARLEAEAEAASERMGLPTVLMFVGFLFLLGYPAVRIILGST